MADTLVQAVLAVQKELPALQKDRINPHFKSKYVSLEAVMREVLPILNKHGLVWITAPSYLEVQEDWIPVLHYELQHVESEQTVEDSIPLFLKERNSQGHGSAITYARRYALMSVLGLVADDDDDGNVASEKSKDAERPASPKIPTDRAQGILGKAEVRDLAKLDRGVVALSPLLKAKLADLGADNGKISNLTVDQAEDIEGWLADAPTG